MSGFEPRISGVGSDRSTNCATQLPKPCPLFALPKSCVILFTFLAHLVWKGDQYGAQTGKTNKQLTDCSRRRHCRIKPNNETRKFKCLKTFNCC